MSASSTLDRAFTDLLGKIRLPAPEGATTLREAVISINFNGGGLALPTAGGMAGLVEVPFASQIVWVHMFAGDDNLVPVAVTASVDLRYANLITFGASGQLYGTSGPPTLTSQSSADIDISDWTHSLFRADAVLFRLISFSGLATWLSVQIGIRGTDAPEGIANVVDAAGDTVVDENGNTVVFRN